MMCFSEEHRFPLGGQDDLVKVLSAFAHVDSSSPCWGMLSVEVMLQIDSDSCATMAKG